MPYAPGIQSVPFRADMSGWGNALMQFIGDKQKREEQVKADAKSHKTYIAMGEQLGLDAKELNNAGLEGAVIIQEVKGKKGSFGYNVGTRTYGDLIKDGVLDPAKVTDPSTFADPHHHAEGIPHVLVNGRLVLRDAKLTDERPGQIVRKSLK